MKPAKLQTTKPTIRFRARLEEALLTLPKDASAKLPPGVVLVEATINGFPFRAALEPDGKGSHCLRVSKVMHDAVGADTGDTVTVEIIRVGASNLDGGAQAAVFAHRITRLLALGFLGLGVVGTHRVTAL